MAVNYATIRTHVLAAVIGSLLFGINISLMNPFLHSILKSLSLCSPETDWDNFNVKDYCQPNVFAISCIRNLMFVGAGMFPVSQEAF